MDQTAYRPWIFVVEGKLMNALVLSPRFYSFLITLSPQKWPIHDLVLKFL